MPNYSATTTLWGCVLCLSNLIPWWLLLYLGALCRSPLFVLGVFCALALHSAHAALPAQARLVCEHASCHWSTSQSSLLSFLLREARVATRSVERSGCYSAITATPQKFPPRFFVQMQLIEPLPPQNVRNISSHWHTTQAHKAIIYGQPDQQNPLTALYAQFGLSHMLCLSAWHAHLIRRQKWPLLIMITLFTILLWLLNAPSPLLRAVIACALPRGETPEERLESWSCSWLLTLMLSPFSWTSWSFWLSWYYGVLFLYCTPSLWSLRLSCLAWIGLWGQSWEPLALALGGVLEPVFLGLLGVAWVTYPLSLILPEATEPMWALIVNLFERYSALTLSIPSSSLFSLFLLAPILCSAARRQISLFRFAKDNPQVFVIRWNNLRISL